MQERTFAIKTKGVKGKDDTPFITLATSQGERLTIHLEDRADLDAYDIDQEFLIVIGDMAAKRQKTLAPEARQKA